MNDFLKIETIVARLKEEYLKFGRLIVAYDFDDTVCSYTKGKPEPTIERKPHEEICILIRELAPYSTLILWTCRSNEGTMPNGEKPLQSALEWLKLHNVPYDKVNEDASLETTYGSRKIYANAVLDDRCGLATMYEALTWFLHWVKQLPPKKEEDSQGE